MELEQLAHEAAKRALDKQENVLDELRSRTSVLIGASALAASFLGGDAFARPNPVLAVLALAAFVITIIAALFILIPRKYRFIFSISASNLYESFYEFRDDTAEVHRRLAYDLERFWIANDNLLQPMFNAFRIGAAGLIVEILTLAALVSGKIV